MKILFRSTENPQRKKMKISLSKIKCISNSISSKYLLHTYTLRLFLLNYYNTVLTVVLILVSTYKSEKWKEITFGLPAIIREYKFKTVYI